MVRRDWNTTVLYSLVIAGGAGVALATLGLIMAGKLLPAVLLVGCVGGVLLFNGSGNPRLLALWGLVLTLPLDMAKRFVLNPHMGGASSLRIDVCDIFLLVLIYYLLRDFFRGRRFWYIPLPAYAYLLMVAAGSLSVLLGPFRTLAMLEIIHMFKLTLLLLVVVNEVLRIRLLEHLVGAMMLSLGIQALIAIIQSGLGHPIGLQFLGEV